MGNVRILYPRSNTDTRSSVSPVPSVFPVPPVSPVPRVPRAGAILSPTFRVLRTASLAPASLSTVRTASRVSPVPPEPVVRRRAVAAVDAWRRGAQQLAARTVDRVPGGTSHSPDSDPVFDRVATCAAWMGLFGAVVIAGHALAVISGHALALLCR